MNDDLRLTDELLHDMFQRRARRGTPDGLRGAILGVTRTTPQRRVSLRVVAGGRVPLRLLAVAALLGASVGVGALIAGGRQPSPPAQHFAKFTAPFDFRPVEGVPTTTPVFGNGIVSFMVGGWGDAGLEPGSHGIIIANPAAGRNGAYVHGCPSGARVPIRLDPEGFVDDLQAIAGIAIQEPTALIFDGRPAVSADVDPTKYRCSSLDFSADFHTVGAAGGLSTGAVPLGQPMRLIVTTVGRETIVLEALADTPGDLEAWLPTATRFLDGIHFDTLP